MTREVEILDLLARTTRKLTGTIAKEVPVTDDLSVMLGALWGHSSIIRWDEPDEMGRRIGGPPISLTEDEAQKVLEIIKDTICETLMKS